MGVLFTMLSTFLSGNVNRIMWGFVSESSKISRHFLYSPRQSRPFCNISICMDISLAHRISSIVSDPHIHTISVPFPPSCGIIEWNLSFKHIPSLFSMDKLIIESSQPLGNGSAPPQ